jgi:hypothetical protein
LLYYFWGEEVEHAEMVVFAEEAPGVTFGA